MKVEAKAFTQLIILGGSFAFYMFFTGLLRLIRQLKNHSIVQYIIASN